jgi:hypothetical protein
MGFQNGGSPNFDNLRTFDLRVSGKMTFECNECGQS